LSNCREKTQVELENHMQSVYVAGKGELSEHDERRHQPE